jgi:D-alanyl-D-alanine dipeptidase
LNTGEEVDMGTLFDFFDPLSWPGSTKVSKKQKANREQLRKAMLQHGFMPLDTEWWHFTLCDEPYQERWFDFPVTEDCRGWQ